MTRNIYIYILYVCVRMRAYVEESNERENKHYSNGHYYMIIYI